MAYTLMKFLNQVTTYLTVGLVILFLMVQIVKYLVDFVPVIH